MKTFRLCTAAFALVLATGSLFAAEPKAADESLLGVLPITGSTEEKLPKVAILPSWSMDFEDVVVRSVVRRDLQLSGLFEMLSEDKTPDGSYRFDDPVDVAPWKNLGAEIIVKVAARTPSKGKVEVFGIAYFTEHGTEPVYQTKIVVPLEELRMTAHRITDALLGAITGTKGGFASRMAFSSRWGRNHRVLQMDSDGAELRPLSDTENTAISPAWGVDGVLRWSESRRYQPYRLVQWKGDRSERVSLPFTNSIYSSAFSRDGKFQAVAVATEEGSSIFRGAIDGAFDKVSTSAVSVHPAFSPSGKLAWVGGGNEAGTPRRIYLDGKAISPAGFSAAAPTFCRTDDGIRLVFAVNLPNDRQDLVMTDERGQGIVRLTQNQGRNSYPACSPDGRLLAFFSTRKQGGPGIYVMSLKRWTTQKLSDQYGESLRWGALPELAKRPLSAPAPAASAGAVPSAAAAPVAPSVGSSSVAAPPAVPSAPAPGAASK